MLRQLTRELDASRTELAEIAGGQLPAALRDGGLRGWARAGRPRRRGASGLPVDLRVDLSGRGATGSARPTMPRPPSISAARRPCRTSSSTRGATRVSIEVTASAAELVFAVTDDGSGFDPAARRMTDWVGCAGWTTGRRCTAAGSPSTPAPGGGTRVRGAIPLSVPADGARQPTRGRHDRARRPVVAAVGLLGAARFVVALAVFGAAELLSTRVLSSADRMPLWLVLVATAVVAVVFWLIREPLDRLVDRLVLGERAGGYEAGRRCCSGWPPPCRSTRSCRRWPKPPAGPCIRPAPRSGCCCPTVTPGPRSGPNGPSRTDRR